MPRIIDGLDFNNFDQQLVTLPELSSLDPGHMFILGANQPSDGQGSFASTVPAHIVDDCGKNTIAANTSYTDFLVIQMNFECSH
ncbi:MAG TPA: hypothetical protein VFR24_22935 [Candidatus Angelobacter sp.]|nr:hypothetical protein [Candidatus Angelobacter sp.]